MVMETHVADCMAVGLILEADGLRDTDRLRLRARAETVELVDRRELTDGDAD